MRRSFGIAVIGLLVVASWGVAACEYQWTIEVPGLKDGRGRQRPPREVSLWISPSCAYVRGVLLGSQTLLEASFLKEPKIRECAERNDLAIVYGAFPDDDIFARFAEVSGYEELRKAPFITVGHSAGGIGARNAAYLQPDRTIAVLHFHSGNYHHHVPEGDVSLTGIPFLAVNGEFEEYAPDCGFKAETGWGLETQWRYGREQLLKANRTLLFEAPVQHTCRTMWRPRFLTEPYEKPGPRVKNSAGWGDDAVQGRPRQQAEGNSPLFGTRSEQTGYAAKSGSFA